ncbi:MAG: DUF2442 domain-containing protein [Elusimicrobiota bacterium]|jgi:hypothetical protein
MRISAAEDMGGLPSILEVSFSKDFLQLNLSDGRILSVPLAWYPRLATANPRQLKRFEISPSGYGIHWPDLDEDLSVYGFLFPNAPLSRTLTDMVADVPKTHKPSR